MLAEERRQKVREIVEEKGRITVEDIVSRFHVSAVTARSDLDVLAKRREVMRSHGGAVRQMNTVVDYPLRFKESIHHAEKVRIGQAAAQLLRPNQSIILDSGTTTVQIARQMGLGNNIRATPAVALGAYEMTPIDVAAGYTAFATLGTRAEPQFIRNIIGADGEVLEKETPQTHLVLDPRVAYLVTSVLKDVLNHGTGAGVRGPGCTR